MSLESRGGLATSISPGIVSRVLAEGGCSLRGRTNKEIWFAVAGSVRMNTVVDSSMIRCGWQCEHEDCS